MACSLASSSPLDRRIKEMLVTDMFHMYGLVPSDRKQVKTEGDEKKKWQRLLKVRYRDVTDVTEVATPPQSTLHRLHRTEVATPPQSTLHRLHRP